MSRSKTVFAVLSLGLTTLFLFQNCGGPGGATEGATNSLDGLTYTNMSAANAQSMIAGYEAQCAVILSYSAAFQTLSNGAEVNVANSVVDAKAFNISTIKGTGNVTLVGTSAGASVNTILDFTGNITLCGLSVDDLSANTYANVLVDGGSLASISGFSGNVFIIGGSFPPRISNFTGNIVVKTSAGDYLGRSYIYR